MVYMMGTKRPHPSGSANPIHPSRRSYVPNDPSNGHTAAKKRKTNPNPHPKPAPKLKPLNPIKSRIRSLQRLLEHDQNMPADVRIGRERELQSLEYDLTEAKREEERRKIIGRWHMVRFFDRQKATRRLKKAKKRLDVLQQEAEGEGNVQIAKEDVRKATVDLNYTMYYPLEMPYPSLWPNEKKQKRGVDTPDKDEAEVDPDEDDVERTKSKDDSQGDREMWIVVEKCMVDQTLNDLRNGKIVTPKSQANADAVDAADKAKKELLKQSNKRKTRDAQSGKQKKAQKDDEDEESDGGFFE